MKPSIPDSGVPMANPPARRTIAYLAKGILALGATLIYKEPIGFVVHESGSACFWLDGTSMGVLGLVRWLAGPALVYLLIILARGFLALRSLSSVPLATTSGAESFASLPSFVKCKTNWSS